MGKNFFLAYLESVLFLDPVLLQYLHILRSDYPDYLFQRSGYLGIINAPVGHDNLAAFNAAGGLHNNESTLLRLYPSRGKIINFAGLFEPYSNNFGHTDCIPFYPIMAQTNADNSDGTFMFIPQWIDTRPIAS